MDFSAGIIKKISDNIIEVIFNRDTEIDEEMMIEIYEKIFSLSKGNPHALIYNADGKNIILSDIARKISGARNYNNVHLISRAIVSQNLVSNIETSFFISHDKPEAETKLFDDKEKAMAWTNKKVHAFLKTD